MPVQKDAECYNMNHKNRGKCVIFNHENFDISFDKRDGTEKDAKRLEITFTRLGFDVTVNNDFTLEEIRKEIENREYLSYFVPVYGFYFLSQSHFSLI